MSVHIFIQKTNLDYEKIGDFAGARDNNINRREKNNQLFGYGAARVEERYKTVEV